MTSRTWSERALAYFRSHAIDSAVAAEHGVAERDGALIFPVLASDGSVFERRRLLGGGPAKVIQPPGVPLAPWWPRGRPEGLPESLSAALVCEGEGDALATITALNHAADEQPIAPLVGLAVCAIPGTSTPSERLVSDLQHASIGLAYLALDADHAGRKATEKLTAALHDAGIRVVPIELPESSDLADCLASTDNGPAWLAGAIADAEAANEEEPPGTTAPERDGVHLISYAEIEPERVEWLWPDRVPRGGITLIVGDPGLGKSLLTCCLAAKVTCGELGKAADVLLVTAEDSSSAVVLPRLELAGADLRRAHSVRVRRDGAEDGIALPDDAAELERRIAERQARLVVIDPLSAHLPEHVNSWRDQSVRRALAPLARIAETHDCAIVVVAHLNKDRGARAIYRTGGSIGLPGAARSALLMDIDPDDPEGDQGSRRVLAHFKSNWGRRAESLAYEIETVSLQGVDHPRLAERGESEHGADALLARSDAGTRDAISSAREFLAAELADGPRPVTEVKKAAEIADIAWRTVERAKPGLIESYRPKGESKQRWFMRLIKTANKPGGLEDGGVADHLDSPLPREIPSLAESSPPNVGDGGLGDEEGLLAAYAALVATDASRDPCRYPKHRGSDWIGDAGQRICGICHPQAGGVE